MFQLSQQKFEVSIPLPALTKLETQSEGFLLPQNPTQGEEDISKKLDKLHTDIETTFREMQD